MLKIKTPKELRNAIRKRYHEGPTAGMAPEFIQTNVVILPKKHADAFRTFAERNPKSCPLIEELAPGKYLSQLAENSDIRTDVPYYRYYENGIFTSRLSSITEVWQKDFVTFLIGCSFTFEASLSKAGLPLRHVEEGRNVPMYKTNINAVAAPPFQGKLVVSMRPMPKTLVDKAIEITSDFPSMHGSPVHVGSPKTIGIPDITRPDYGDPVTVNSGEVPMFWACGVTPQNALLEAELPVVITHEPGHMFITDIKNETYKQQ